MIKSINSLLLFFIFSYAVNGQNSMLALYNVTRPITITGEPGKIIPITLNYEGRVFQQDSKVLLYMRPLFLEEYPEGRITYTYPGGVSSYMFSKDSMLLPELYHTDSLQKWAGFNDSRNSKLNEYITLKYNTQYWKWEILPETRVINGFNCQRAKYYFPNQQTEAKVFWDIWFCKDITFPFSFMSLQSAPGLIVEADNLQSNWHFKLTSLQQNVPIAPETFWPQMFINAEFKNLGNPQTPRQKKEKITQDKRQNIMGQ